MGYFLIILFMVSFINCDDIKFHHYPYFSNDSLNYELENYPHTFNSLMLNSTLLIDKINIFLKEYEKLYMTSCINQFDSLSLNYINYYFYLYYIIRLTKIYKEILIFKYDNIERESYDIFIQKLNKKYPIPVNENEYYELIKFQNPKLFINISEIKIEILKKELNTYIKNEKEFRKFENENYYPGIRTFNVGIKFIIYIINNSINKISELKIKSTCDSDLNFFLYLQQIQTFSSLYHKLFLISSSNLMNLNENSKEWKLINPLIKKVKLFPKEQMKKSIKEKIVDNVALPYSSIFKSFSITKNPILRNIYIGFFLGYYYFDTKNRDILANKFLLNVNYELLEKVWNLEDTKLMKFFMKFSLPKIKTSKTILIEKLEPSISNLIKDSNLNENNKKTTFENEQKEKIKALYLNCENCTNRNTIIFHIHGGGFISMSPYVHQNYLRKWSNKLKIPILSIDYKHSPKFPFPIALNEIYQSYIWLIKKGEKELNIKINDIILAGDSAGGNLILSLTNILIIKKIKLPKVLLLFYPNLKMTNDLTLSYLNSINDKVLSNNFHLIGRNSYIGNFTNETNQFISPLFTDENILKKYPIVRFFSGSADPLRDDSYLFLQKLSKLNVNVLLKEFIFFPHGFLNYDSPIMMKEAATVGDEIIKDIDELISIKG